MRCEQAEPATIHAAQDLLAEFNAAIESERTAREAVSQARVRQLRALKALRAAGVSMDRVAYRLEKSQGRVPSLKERLRVAASLRKRLSRAGVTGGHEVQPSIGGGDRTAFVALSGQPTKEALTMPEPKLIKRTTTTTTEEFADDLDLDEADALDGLKDDEQCESDRKAPDSADERSRRRK